MDSSFSLSRFAVKVTFLSWLVCLLCGVGSLAAQTPDVDTLEEEAFKSAAAVAEPSIVQIQTIGGLDVVGELIAGTGPTTGVIVSPEGEILTSSFNFASKPSSIIVTLGDGRKLHSPAAISFQRAMSMPEADLPYAIFGAVSNLSEVFDQPRSND